VSALPSVRDRSWGVRQPGLIADIGTLIVIEAHFDSCSATLIYTDSQHFRMRQGVLLFDDGTVIRSSTFDSVWLSTLENSSTRYASN
jgi:hypothetical protein